MRESSGALVKFVPVVFPYLSVQAGGPVCACANWADCALSLYRVVDCVYRARER